MRKFLTCLSGLVFLAAATASARADTFTVVGGGNTYTFQVPSDPAPAVYLVGTAFDLTADVSENGAPAVSDSFTFFAAPQGGMLEDLVFNINLYGPQLYSGSEADPVFLLGSFLGSENDDGLNDYSVSISPEPSSLALLATGMVGAFGAARRRFKA